jgi:peptidoglycan/LPS O-acetylase OafA/YrhL
MMDGRGTADSHEAKYRSDLDGLRALAVMAVIVFHISRQLLPGGYLGVDIFFVLSGFLITSMIWRECLKGDFSIGRFYERRFRRIMPALVLLLVVASLCSAALLLPLDLVVYAKSVFATLAFVANVYFWRDTNYFAPVADEKPLLHVWSLGIEEQFYLIFLLLAMLAVRWHRNALLKLTWGLVVISLLTNILSLKMGEATPAFFFLAMRAWELGTGALLALTPPAGAVRWWLRQGLAVVGAVLLCLGLLLNYRFPGGLVPVAFTTALGTTTVSHFGTVGGYWLTRVFSIPVIVWIGLISYSLYLWHWPILVFPMYYLVQTTLSPLQATIAIASMFVLATLSWRYVERPFRDSLYANRSSSGLGLRRLRCCGHGGCGHACVPWVPFPLQPRCCTDQCGHRHRVPLRTERVHLLRSAANMPDVSSKPESRGC